MSRLSPRQRVEVALRGGHSGCVPFTMYECMIPQCSCERALRNRGLCIVDRFGVFRTHRPHVQTRHETFWKDGKCFTRTWHATPVGDLTTLSEDGGFTSWTHERMFKSPDDYKKLLFLIQDECYEPAYGAFLDRQEWRDEDFILRAGIGLEPMQSLISGDMLDMEDFCIQWMENRDEILKLYRAIAENHRKIYPIVAQSPALHANYGGNVVPEIVGPEMFDRYYAPHYHEAAEIMHRHGKLIGCHYDDDCRLLAPSIAATDLDYIEAFTPAPGSDLTLAQARAAWPNKVIWINFPSAVHLESDAAVERAAYHLVEELGGRLDGFLVGIMEDIPSHRWRQSCTAIMDGLERHAREKPKLYG